MAELAAGIPDPPPYFATQLCGRLYDEGAVLALLQGWLERNFGPHPQETLQRERTRRSKDVISISNAFNSLRLLAELDWKDCFERLSKVEAILRLDPAGTYPGMDFATRDRYRRAVEDLHRGSRLPEEHVARRVVEMAAGAHVETDPAAAGGPVHIGHFLIGEGRPSLARHIGCRETFRFRMLHWAEKHHTLVYALGLSGFTAALLGPAVRYGVPDLTPAVQLLFAALLLVPASQLAMDILNKLIIRFFPPRPLAKMDFRKTGIPDSCLTEKRSTGKSKSWKYDSWPTRKGTCSSPCTRITRMPPRPTVREMRHSCKRLWKASKPWPCATEPGGFTSSTGNGAGAGARGNSSAGNGNGANWKN
jgi:cyclic beta-1,2-glucan synthetase